MNNFFTVLLFISLLGFNCDNSVSDYQNPGNITIKSGTSFGMCAGYCISEIEITKDKVIFKRWGWIQGNPPLLKIEGDISNDEWESIKNEVNINKVKKLDDVYGCPDCADGGAEWIQIEGKNFSKKIEFEYNKTVEPVSELIKKVREIRKRFEEKLPL